ncbi:MAG: hypothetical protein FJ095_20960 [Deltaproteobacteria bacterium]|nr:hypothetical protein [Deltaproteobacteria bacterium]
MIKQRRSPLKSSPRLRAVRAVALALSLVTTACGDNLSFVPEGAAPSTGASAPLACLPNLDGRIDAAEAAPRLDVTASYLASPPGETRPVALVGSVDGEGRRVWRLDASFASDRGVSIGASALSSAWYASSFPGGTFAVPLDAEGALVGIYSHDEAALHLHGLASVDAAPAVGKTLIVYEEPVAVLRFPLEPGASWLAVGRVTDGVLRGLPYVGEDRYALRDDAVGRVELPDVVFTQAHRVRTTLTVAPAAGAEVVTRQTAFVFECFGELARATSAPGEPTDDFTVASALRRLDL